MKALLEKHSLDADEKEAVMKAIGLLSLGSLAMTKIKVKKAKRDKDSKW